MAFEEETCPIFVGTTSLDFADLATFVSENMKKNLWNLKCEVKVCSLRQPGKFKFFLECQWCQFGHFCRFSHSLPDKPENIKEIENLKMELKDVKKKLTETENEIEEKEQEIQNIRSENNIEVGIKSKELESEKNKNNKLQENYDQAVFDKKKELSDKVKKIEQHKEEILKERESLDERIKMSDKIKLGLEEKVQSLEKENQILQEEKSTVETSKEDLKLKINEMKEKLKESKNVENPEKSEKQKEEVNWCYACEFVGKTKENLLTHIKTKHMKKSGQQ